QALLLVGRSTDRAHPQAAAPRRRRGCAQPQSEERASARGGAGRGDGMSEPARRLQRPAPVVAPSRPAARPRPSRSLPVPGPAMPRPSARVRRRRGTIGFLVLSTAVVGSMILGVVALNALLVQSSFRVDDLQQRIAAL